MKNVVLWTKSSGLFASTLLLAGLVAARADSQSWRVYVSTDPTLAPDAPVAPVAPVTATAEAQGSAGGQSSSSAAQDANDIIIQTIELDGKKKHGREVAWLGLAVKESSDDLASQLSLKPGEGLTVVLVAPGSPAEKADVHKNDVLVDLDGQMLVYPIQFRKLIQMHAEGDTVKLTYYRAGKKETSSIKLGKTTWDDAANLQDESWPGNLRNLQLQLGGLSGKLRGVDASLERTGLDKAQMRLEIKRTMEQTRKAIEDAMRHASTSRGSLVSVDQELGNLAHAGLDVDKDATVIVRNKRNSNRTIVRTDEDGSFIIEAGATTHLSARDKDGNLLFEGPIDTPAQREKVPKEIWEKVKPLLDQVVVPSAVKPKTEGRFWRRGEIVKQSVS